MKDDPAVEEAFGWMQEMYAYVVASAIKPGGPMQYKLMSELAIEPPSDTSLRVNGLDAYILHYTYSSEFSEDGEWTEGVEDSWHFDKRMYNDDYPPQGGLSLPPEKADAATVKRLMEAINEASSAHDNWQFVE